MPKIWNTQQWLQDWKSSVPKKGNTKECSNYHTIALFHTLARLCSKSFKLGFSSTWIKNFHMFKLGLEKAEEPEIKLPIFIRLRTKLKSSRKISTSALLTVFKPLTVWITRNCGKVLKKWDYQTTLPVFWETCMQVKKQQLELNVRQQTGLKFGKEYVKAEYCH